MLAEDEQIQMQHLHLTEYLLSDITSREHSYTEYANRSPAVVCWTGDDKVSQSRGSPQISVKCRICGFRPNLLIPIPKSRPLNLPAINPLRCILEITSPDGSRRSLPANRAGNAPQIAIKHLHYSQQLIDSTQLTTDALNGFSPVKL